MSLAHPFYTLAYPRIAAADRTLLDTLRHAHDPQVTLVAPHFTLVFGCKAIAEHPYLAHISQIASTTPAIDFHCRYAMLGADDINDTAYVFLVPDAGNSAIALLHDRLYTGVLAEHLRLDFPYIPHITVGATQDRQAAKSLCDALNRTGIDIAGRLLSLTVGVLRDKQWQTVAEFPLTV